MSGHLTKDMKKLIVSAGFPPFIKTSEKKYAKNEFEALRPFMKIRYSQKNCHYCNTKLQRRLKTIDHKIPLTRGGTNDEENLVMSCLPCNLKKSWMTESEFRTHGTTERFLSFLLQLS